ncbi:MAG: Ig-like domain-containing protein [Clostridiales Family XIII bacterium]|jgi:uncharacterized protein YjdB|nr:Ig-like domain-containing protein [Clostridiales Family XIII bacterium]
MKRKNLKRCAVLLAAILASTQIFGATSFAAPAAAPPDSTAQALQEDNYRLSKDAADSIVTQLFGGGALGAAKLATGPDGSAYEYEFSGDFAGSAIEEMAGLAGQGSAAAPGDADANDLPNGYVDNSKYALDKIISQLNTKPLLRRAPGSDVTAEVVFVIDTTGSMGPYIEAVKTNVARFAQYLAEKSINLRLGLIEYRDIAVDGLGSTKVSAPGYTTWMDAAGFLGELSKMYAYGGGDTPETPWDAFGYLFNGTMLWSDDAYKFAMLITDAPYWDNNRHGITDIDDVISRLSAAEIQASVVTHDSNTMYGNLAGYTGGIIASLTSNFSTVLSQYADSILSGTMPTINYPVRVVDGRTGLPIGSASVSHAAGRTATDSNGIAMLSGKSGTFAELSVSKPGYETFMLSSLSLDMGDEVYVIELTPLDDDPDASPILTKDMFGNPPEASATLSGPMINVLGKDLNLFNIPAEFSLNIFDPSKFVIKHYDRAKRFEVIIGASASKVLPSDPDWSVLYKRYKNAVIDFSEKSAGDLYNEFRRHLRGAAKAYPKLVFPIDGYIGGYGEASYASGELKFLNGGIIVCSDTAKANWEYPFPAAPYVFVKVEFSYDVKGRLGLIKVSETGKIGAFQPDSIGLAPDVSGALSLGIPKVAAVGGGITGKLDTNISFPFTSFSENVSAKFIGSFLFRLRLLFFESREEFNFGGEGVALYPSSASPMARAARIGEVTASDFEPIPRSVPEPTAFSARLLAAPPANSTFYMPDVYSNGTPQIVQLDSSGKALMVWVGDDASRSVANKSALYYSVYDDGAWGPAAQVDNNGTADASPTLVADGGSAHLVWQDAKRVFADSVTLEEALGAMDIKYAKFDGASNAFGSIASLASSSTNTKYEASPIIAAKDGAITVAWIENSLNDPLLMSGQNTIMTKKFDRRWNAERAAVNGLSLITNFAINSESYVAYTTGQLVDGNIIHNGILYTRTPTGSGRNYTGVSAAESTSRAITGLQAVGDEFFWSFSSGTKSMRLPGDNAPKRENNFSFPQFTVAGSFDGASKAILTTVANGLLNEIYASYKDEGGLWSTPVPLSDYGMNVSGLSGFLNPDGDICAAFNRTDILESGATDLTVAVFQQSSALEVNEDAYFSDYDLIPGETMDISVLARNNGARSITGLKALIYRDGVLFDEVETLYTIPEDSDDFEKVEITAIAAGEELYLEIPYEVPDPLYPHTVSIEILAAGEEPGLPGRTASASIKSFADLEFESVAISREAYDPELGTLPGANVSATIKNAGYVAANDVRIDLYNEDGIISGVPNMYADLGDIAAGSAANITFHLGHDMIEAASSVDFKFFRLVATTASAEWDLADNEADVLLPPILAEDIQLAAEEITLEVGETAQVEYELTPPTAYSGVFWLSSNSNVASVDSITGLITAKRDGDAIITVSTADGSKTDSLIVHVTDTTSVRGVTIAGGDLSMAIGETASLTATVVPETAANKNVSWHSSNTAVATVENGVVTAVGEGEADIVVVTDSGGYTASVKVSVSEEAKMATYVTLTPVRMNIKKDALAPLTFSTDGTSYKFTSAAPRIAEVDAAGVVRGIRAGTTVITLELTDGSGLTAVSLVTVSY